MSLTHTEAVACFACLERQKELQAHPSPAPAQEQPQSVQDLKWRVAKALLWFAAGFAVAKTTGH